MDYQFCVVDVIYKFISYVGKGRFIQQEFIGDFVYVECFRIYQLIGFQIDVKIVIGQVVVDYFYGVDFNDFVFFVVCFDLVYIGGFGIENNLVCNCSVYSGYLCQIYCL